MTLPKSLYLVPGVKSLEEKVLCAHAKQFLEGYGSYLLKDDIKNKDTKEFIIPILIVLNNMVYICIFILLNRK